MASSDYQVDDREVLLRIYQRLLFAPALAMVPWRVAPNTITVFGVTCSTLSVAAALLAVSGTPSMYLLSALSLLVYLTSDNVDGPHARRTGRSSKLGELLDHGLDGVASGAVLLTAGIILRMDGVFFLLLAMLGAIGFTMPFWEQYRTGTLVIPALSSAEGITVVALLDLVLYFAEEPAWLRFSLGDLNATTGVLLFTLVCYVVVIAAPIVRVARGGERVRELVAPMALAGGSLLYILAGAGPLWPAVMVSLLAADLTCRMIAVRHGFREASLMTHLDAAMLVPALIALGLPALWQADGWAALGAALAAARYLRTIAVAGAYVRGIDRQQPAQPEAA